MSRLIIYINLFVGLLMGNYFPLIAQKKALDVKACTIWKRVDAPDLSPTGRWVTYHLNYMENDTANEKIDGLHLFDTKTRKEQLLDGSIRQLNYYNQDRNAYYDLVDSAGVTQTYLLSLHSGKQKKWNHAESFQPIEGTPYSMSVITIPKNKIKNLPSFKRLVIRDLDTEEAFYIDSIGRYTLYDNNRSILFICKTARGNNLCYGPLKGPYNTLYQGNVLNEPSSYSFDRDKGSGEFNVNDSLWYTFSVKKSDLQLVFDKKDIVIPNDKQLRTIELLKNHRYVLVELTDKKYSRFKDMKKNVNKDNSFELELWTWDELEVPTMQSESNYQRIRGSKYFYDMQSRQLIKIASSDVDLQIPYQANDINYVYYMDESPYFSQKEWLDNVPFDIYAVNVHTGETRLIGRRYREMPKWSPTGQWALMYDPIAQVWNKFDIKTGEVTDISTAIGHPMYDEKHDSPSPAPAYGIAGWSADGQNVFLYDAFDWWKINLTGTCQPVCFTQGYGRKNGKVIRKKTSNISKNIFDDKTTLVVSLIDQLTMDEGLYRMDMSGHLKKLMEGPYMYTIRQFSQDQKYCLWIRQNANEFRDIWVSKSDFSRLIQVTHANPQQSNYQWGNVKLIEWKNYANKTNRGLLYLPDNYDKQKDYPLIVQFYEKHTHEMHLYHAPRLCSALGNPLYFTSNGYIVFMPDVHFTVGNPGQSSYDAVISGVNYLIQNGIAKPGKIGLQGHSWSGFQTSYLVTKTDIFSCANIAAPVTDMITGYLSLRNGSGMPRYFMYEETQSRMGKPIWKAKEQYLRHSVLLEADKISTPLLILHNDQDEAVPYEQGRALYLAMRRLQRPAWLLNYKGEGHFVTGDAARKDWTIRMMQFFDYYLKGTKEPRWMKEGIHLNDRGMDQKYDFDS